MASVQFAPWILPAFYIVIYFYIVYVYFSAHDVSLCFYEGVG